jgi:hypothetical protein
MKRLRRSRKVAKSLPDSALPVMIRESRTKLRRRLRQLELELELLTVLEEQLLERFRLLCTRPTRKETAP